MAWTKSVENEYAKAITTTALAMADTAVVASDTITDDIGGAGALLGLDITIAGNAVTSSLVLQVSHDATTWITAATLAANVSPAVTGVKLYNQDTLGIQAPYYRLVFNVSAGAAGTTGRIKFIYSALIPGSAFYMARYS